MSIEWVIGLQLLQGVIIVTLQLWYQRRVRKEDKQFRETMGHFVGYVNISNEYLDEKVKRLQVTIEDPSTLPSDRLWAIHQQSAIMGLYRQN